ncbi:hypothetical protein ABIA96_000463 [Bradyrhizobium sp. LB11.1]
MPQVRGRPGDTLYYTPVSAPSLPAIETIGVSWEYGAKPVLGSEP